MDFGLGGVEIGDEFVHDLGYGLHFFDGAGYLADFEFTVLQIAFDDASLRCCPSEQLAELAGFGTTAFGFGDFCEKLVFNQSGGRNFLQRQHGAVFAKVHAKLLEGIACRTFLAHGKQCANLHALCSECHSRKHRLA